MDLPIDKKELDTLVRLTGRMAGDGLGKRNVDAERIYNKSVSYTHLTLPTIE